MKKHLILYFIILATALISCKKTADAPSTGSISGSIKPAAAITGITITNTEQSTISYTTLPDTAIGDFKLAGIIPGPYKIHFTTIDAGFQPDDKFVTVAAGSNSNAGDYLLNIGVVSGTAELVMYIIFDTQAPDGTYNYITLDNTGVFKKILSPGKHTLSFLPVKGYKSPGDAAISLAAGQSLNLGQVYMVPNMLTGVPMPVYDPTQTYTAPNLSINSSYFDADYRSTQTFKLVMDDIKGPGTYTCKGTPASNIIYTLKNNNSAPKITYSIGSLGSSGTVVVTSVDEIKREIKGTFTATLIIENPTRYYSSSQTINNGSFYFRY